MAQIIEQSGGLKFYQSSEPFRFVNGQEIEQLVLAFETYGTLSDEKDNVILIHHALSTNSHVASHEKNTNAGWWEPMVGPGKFVDTTTYFVICINNLGSCFGSSSPAITNTRTEKVYRYHFPVYTFLDVVNAQKQLLNYLQITTIHTLIGPSLGGMISLMWATHYPEMVNRLISISSAAKAYAANIANRAIQREIIQLDPDWNHGFYVKNPQNGFKAARKLGLYTYRSSQEFDERFPVEILEPIPQEHDVSNCDVESYLEYNAKKFIKTFDVNCYLYLLKAMDLFTISQGFRSEEEAYQTITAKTLVVSVDSDRLFQPFQQEEMYHHLGRANKNVRYIKHRSKHGHDTFLIETDAMGAYIQAFINDED